MPADLTTDLDSEEAIPYFLWSEPMTVGELRKRISADSDPDRFRLIGTLLREARDPDVWRFTTPREVERDWRHISRYLGRRRAFWEFLLGTWRREGLL